MSKVKQGFNGLTVPQQIERGRLITGNMTGNANYGTPNPTIPTVITATDALEVAYNESRGRDKNKTAAMRLRRKELLYLIGQLSAYVQQASGGDEEKILSSGFDVAKAKVPLPVIAGVVNNLRLSDGLNSGKIKVEWDAASYAVIYVILVAESADFANVQPKAITTKTQKEISDLKPGTTYWVKVLPLGREEMGPMSTPASIIAR